jgi:hypothetical protein
VDAAHTSRPKLGQLLVEGGLLTEPQLEDALNEAQANGRKLGSVLVERGILSGPALANFLADQQGGIIRTEYGIATGFKGHTAPPPTAERTEYVVVLERGGEFALFAGAGQLPDEGVEVAFPGLEGERLVVARHEWRRCVVVEPVSAQAPSAHAA